MTQSTAYCYNDVNFVFPAVRFFPYRIPLQSESKV